MYGLLSAAAAASPTEPRSTDLRLNLSIPITLPMRRATLSSALDILLLCRQTAAINVGARPIRSQQLLDQLLRLFAAPVQMLLIVRQVASPQNENGSQRRRT